MNCRQFQKYAGAFADGELDLQLNLEALEHLNLCRDCAVRVDEVAALRSALEGLWADHRAPEYLTPRILRALRAESQTVIADDPDKPPHSAGHASEPRRTSPWLVPLAVAAALLFAVFAWQNWTPVESGTLTLMAARTCREAANTHLQCVRDRWQNHHDPTLSRDRKTMAMQLTERLGVSVIAPDYSASGFTCLGADVCPISGRPAAHVLYRDPVRSVALSVFSSARIPEFRPDSVSALGDSDIYVRRVGEVTVAALTVREQTYTFCSDLAEKTLLEMVHDVHTAARNPVRGPISALAFAAGNVSP